MNIGKTLFAQIMEFVPWTSLSRIVQRYSGDSGVRRLTCAEQFRVMALPTRLPTFNLDNRSEGSVALSDKRILRLGSFTAVARATALNFANSALVATDLSAPPSNAESNSDSYVSVFGI